jgi:hypothetical protein
VAEHLGITGGWGREGAALVRPHGLSPLSRSSMSCA